MSLWELISQTSPDNIVLIATSTVTIVGVVWKSTKRVKTTLELIQRIDREFRPNSGTSLKDVVNKTKLEVEQLTLRAEERFKILHKNLQRLDQSQKIIFNQSSCGIYETDVHGLCVWVNTTYQQLSGRTLEELMGNGWINTLDQDHRLSAQTAWELATKTGSMFDMELKLIHPITGPILVHSRAWPIMGEGGITGFLGTACPMGEKHL